MHGRGGGVVLLLLPVSPVQALVCPLPLALLTDEEEEQQRQQQHRQDTRWKAMDVQ